MNCVTTGARIIPIEYCYEGLYDQCEDEHECKFSNFACVYKGPLWSYCGLLMACLIFRKYVIPVLRYIQLKCKFDAPIATKVVCSSRLLKCLRSLYGK